MEHQKISVIIPTRNRPGDVIQCIESILSQTQLPDEIIIVDASDNEELGLEIKACFQAKGEMAYIRSQPGLTYQRNIGVEASSGDIIIFLDDDVILDKEYIKGIMYVFSNDSGKRVGGVTGNIMNNTHRQSPPFKYLIYLIGRYIGQILGTIFFLFKYGDGKFQPSGFPTHVHSDKITQVECLSGANMAFRREVFNEFKFDENLHGYSWGEDDDFSYRVSRKYQNVYTPYAKLIHKVSPAARDKEYDRMKMLIENHYYLFNKSLPQDFKHRFAFWWSVVGLFVMGIIERNKEGLTGLKDGIISIRKLGVERNRGG